jgi:hypothetical protein
MSNEENLIVATSHDFEFAQRLFDELNSVIVGPLGDDKIIILSVSDEEEVREDKTTSTKDATAFAAVNPTSTASADADDAPTGAKMIIVMIVALIRRLAATTVAEMTPMSLRPPHQKGTEAGVLHGELQ